MSEIESFPGGGDSQARALQVLDAAVLEVREGCQFSEVDPTPPWWGEIFGSPEDFPERSPFLEDFTEGAARDFWLSGEDSDEENLYSGIWEETTEAGEARHFEAIACRGKGEGGPGLLIVVPADEPWRREQISVQAAHDEVLSRRLLGKEIEKKQVLLECIMHDLGNPLATVLMNLQHLNRQLGEGDEALRPALSRAITQAERQRTLIRSIADVFAADLAGAKGSESEAGTTDLATTVMETVSACAPAAAEKGVTLCPFFSGSIPVVGEALPLSRVVENLLSNAIRYSPERSRVTITLDRSEKMAVCRIEDEGPGIEPTMDDRLFEPFSQGRNSTGQSGLGLYFCRMTVEMWGGKISGSNRLEGGACFEFCLPMPNGVAGPEK